MANTLTNVMHKILARGLTSLRESVIMPRLVNSDWSTEAAKKGDVINVPVPVAKTAAAVSPAPTAPADTDYNPDTVQIPLDQWYSSDFHMEDKQMVEVDRNEHFIPMGMDESIRALANQVNGYLMDLYKQVGNSVDATTDDIPFDNANNGPLLDTIALRKKLNETITPKDRRVLIIDYAAEAQMLLAAPFRDASQSGETAPVIQGNIGRKLGFDIFTDDAIPSHTAGTGANFIINGSPAARATSIPMDGGTGTILAGDVITFSTHTQQYAVTAALAGGSLTIFPGLKVAVADAVAVTVVKADTQAYPVIMAFHPNAIAFATRPLSGSSVDTALGTQIASQQDPISGLTLRVEVSRQHKQTKWDLDMLWGGKVVRPEYICRLQS